MAQSQALWMLSATSACPMCTSIITAPSSRPLGLAMPLPAMSGALPWMASNMATVSPMLAEPPRPTEPVISAAMSLMMSPYRLGVTMTSKMPGSLASLALPMSMMKWFFSMSGYSAPISSKTLWNRPSVSFMMLSLLRQVTLLRLLARAYSKA